MDFSVYLENLEKKLQSCFDIEKNYSYKELEYDMYAEYNVINARYFMMKSAKVYSIESNEYCFIKHYEELDAYHLELFINNLKSAVTDFVKPHEDHMSSVITGVIVVDQSYSQDLINIIKKFKFHKGFAFGYKGWADIKLVVTTLNTGEVITNKKGGDIQKVYQL